MYVNGLENIHIEKKMEIIEWHFLQVQVATVNCNSFCTGFSKICLPVFFSSGDKLIVATESGVLMLEG